MGTRGNVYVHNGERAGVFLYQHYDAYDLPKVVAAALRKQARWDDVDYLARIIFSEMIAGDVQGTSGYGISAAVGDGGDRIVDVDTSTRTVKLSPLFLRSDGYADDFAEKTFAEFSLLDS